jgi:hypothetical protein
MTATALSMLSTLITVCGSAYPLGSKVLSRFPNCYDTNSSIRDKCAETDGLHNLSCPLKEKYISVLKRKPLAPDKGTLCVSIIV